MQLQVHLASHKQRPVQAQLLVISIILESNLIYFCNFWDSFLDSIKLLPKATRKKLGTKLQFAPCFQGVLWTWITKQISCFFPSKHCTWSGSLLPLPQHIYRSKFVGEIDKKSQVSINQLNEKFYVFSEDLRSNNMHAQ